MILFVIIAVIGVLYSAVAFQLGKTFEHNADQEMQTLNLAFSQNLGKASDKGLFNIEQTSFQNHIFSSQSQYTLNLGDVQTIKFNAKTRHGPLIAFQPMRYLTVYELEKDANTAKLFQAAGDKSPIKITVKTNFGNNSDIRTEIPTLRFDKTATLIFYGLDSHIQTNQEKSFIKGKWQSNGFKVFGLGAEFIIDGLKGTLNLKQNNGLYVGDNSYSINNIKIDGGEVAKMITVNPTASIDNISYSSQSNKVNGDYQTLMAFSMNNTQVAGYSFGNLTSNIQLDKLPIDIIQKISSISYRQLSKDEKEKLLIDILKTNPVAKINLSWENEGKKATALLDFEGKMPKKSFTQSQPQDFIFRASMNIDIPKEMIHHALSQSLMIVNMPQTDANNKAQQWLNRIVAESNGLLVEDSQSYKTNIIFNNNKLLVNGVEQDWETLGKTQKLPETHDNTLDELPLRIH